MGRYMFIRKKKSHTFRNLFITLLLACICVTAVLFHLSNLSASADLDRDGSGQTDVTTSVYGPEGKPAENSGADAAKP